MTMNLSWVRKNHQATYRHTNSRGETYYLHARQVQLRSGSMSYAFYFAKSIRRADALSRLPAGYAIRELPRSQMPVLARMEPMPWVDTQIGQLPDADQA